MEKEEFKKHYELEETHWWFAGRRRIIFTLLKKYFPPDHRFKILDAGCGTGINLQYFVPFGTMVGCDISIDALQYCQKRGMAELTQGDGGALPFQSETFDGIMLLDVLYHQDIKNDSLVLYEVHRVLKNDGWLLITDSAFNFLRSSHDIAFHTRERYTTKVLKGRLQDCGFAVKKISYFNFFLFPIIALVRIWEKKKVKASSTVHSDLKPFHPKLNAFLRSILYLEACLLTNGRFPFGSSIICLCTKKEERSS